eukprot:210015_1
MVDIIYHCMNFNSKLHPDGYDLCEFCYTHQSPNSIDSSLNKLAVIDNEKDKYKRFYMGHSVQDCSFVAQLVKVIDGYTSYGSIATDERCTDRELIKTLNDFHHILSAHDNEKDFTFITNALGVCNLDECDKYRRNTRDRCLISNIDHNIPTVATQILDKIHCHYFHSFNIGFKLKRSEKAYILEHNDSEINDEKKCVDAYDTIAYKMQSLINLKQKLRTNVINLERINPMNKINKFKMQLHETKDVTYDYGVRYFYWDYYAYNNAIVDCILPRGMRAYQRPTNRRYKLKHWYVKSIYHSLKDELLNNKICTISAYQWDILMLKAETHLHTKHAKTIKCTDSDKKEIYGIDVGQVISVIHLLAMMIYCNEDTLQAKFSETYRKLSINETDESLKKRHSNYAHLGKLLREFVECFGTKSNGIWNLIEQPLFHGVDTEFQFETVRANIKGPFSCTTDFAVALNFSSHKGLIIELSLSRNWIYGKDDSQKNAFIECYWLSDFSNEQELFFIGGFDDFHFNTIIKVANGANFCYYINGIHSLSQIIMDPDSATAINVYNSKSFIQMCFRLLSNELCQYYPNNGKYYKFNSLPEYARKLFHNHCSDIERIFLFSNTMIGLGSASLYKNYRQALIQLFRSLFFDDYFQIKWDVLNVVFSSLKEIYLMPAMFSEERMNLKRIRQRWKPFFQSLSIFLRKNKKINLRQISIELDESTECKNMFMNVTHMYGNLLQKHFWDIVVSKRDNGNHRLLLSSKTQFQ